MYQSTINALRVLANALETNSVTSEEIKAGAVALLGLIDPTAPYGKDLFEALARLTITVTPELVILRAAEDGSKEVLLRQRGSEEAYANQWHSPGSAIRPGESLKKVMDRLVTHECSGDFTQAIPVPRGYHNNLTEERGHFFQVIYVLDATDIAVSIGPKLQWFSVDALPEGMVENHRKVVLPMALGRYGSSGNIESFAF